MEQNFSPAHPAALNRFAHIVWGNPQALLRPLGPQGVEFIDLSEFSLAFRYLTSGILRDDKILVRDEYRAALPVLQTDGIYRNGAYVTGQPGIGKTYFLIYSLVQFLGQKQPVAMQPLNGTKVYLLFKDTVDLYPIDHDTPLHECSFVWALCDSNATIEIPAGAFLTNQDKVRIIQATPPESSRYKGWSKQHDASGYVMDIWTEEEIKNLATLLRLDVERMITLASKWGTVPRTLLRYVNRQDQDVEGFYRGLMGRAVENCPIMMDGGSRLDLPPGAPSLFYFIRPRKIATGGIDRELSDVTVPTRTLRELLGEGLQGRRNQVKLEFYMSLSQCAVTRQAARCIYESWFHCFILAGKKMECQWIAQGSDDDMAQLPTTIQGTKNLIPTTFKALKTATPPYYWLPPRTNFPGIDGVLVLEKQVIAFQVTISADHKSPIQGLVTLRKRLPSSLKNVHWRVVFVGGEASSIKGVAEQWAGKLCVPTQVTHVPVAWSEVDSMQNDVIYKAYRDEDEADPVLTESDQETMEVDQE